MEKIKDKSSSLEVIADKLLEMGIELFEGKQKQAFIMLKSAIKLMNTAMDCAYSYTLPDAVESYSEEELEYIHHFFEALCESIEDFQKEIVPVKK